MKIKELIEKLQQYDPELEVILYNNVGKGIRKDFNVKYPTYFKKEKIVYSLSKFPISEDNKAYNTKYERNEGLIIS